MEENLEHLETKYKECIMKILENENISLVEREFYVESPNWYNNNDTHTLPLCPAGISLNFCKVHFGMVCKQETFVI